jgi:hypothetical protein
MFRLLFAKSQLCSSESRLCDATAPPVTAMTTALRTFAQPQQALMLRRCTDVACAAYAPYAAHVCYRYLTHCLHRRSMPLHILRPPVVLLLRCYFSCHHYSWRQPLRITLRA